MSLVATKCPNCGASIMIDAGSQEGYCSYCGSKLKIQEVIQHVKIDKTGDAANYLSLAEVAYKGDNAEETYEYANKALELDVQNAEAWLFKLRAQEIDTRLHLARKSQEAIACGNKVIELNPSLTHEVYNLWLTIAKDFVASRADKIPDSVIYIVEYDDLEQQVMPLRYAVPNEEITKDTTLTASTLSLAKAWSDYEYYTNKYGDTIGYASLKKYQQCLDNILEGVPEETKYNSHIRTIYNGKTFQGKKQIKEASQNDIQKGCIVLMVFILSIIWIIYKLILY